QLLFGVCNGRSTRFCCHTQMALFVAVKSEEQLFPECLHRTTTAVSFGYIPLCNAPCLFDRVGFAVICGRPYHTMPTRSPRIGRPRSRCRALHIRTQRPTQSDQTQPVQCVMLRRTYASVNEHF